MASFEYGGKDGACVAERATGSVTASRLPKAAEAQVGPGKAHTPMLPKKAVRDPTEAATGA